MGKYAQKLGGKYSKKLGQTTPEMMSAHKPYQSPVQMPRSSGDNVFKQVLNAMAPVMSPVTPLQRAEGIGTVAEFGLPMLATGLSLGYAMGAAPALGAVGTGFKESLIDLATGQSTSLGDKGQKMAESMAWGVAGQGLGTVAGKALSKAAAPFAQSVEPQALQTAKAMGIKYLPSEVLKESKVGPSLVQAGERVLGSTITGGAVLNPLRTARVEKIVGYAKNELNSLITSLDDPSVVGKIAQEGLENNLTTFKGEAGKIFRVLDNAIKRNVPSKISKFPVESKILTEGGTPFVSEGTKEIPRAVNIGTIKRFANGILKKLPEEQRVAIGKGGQEADNFYKQLKEIAELPDDIRFEDAAYYRSQLLATVRQSGQVVNSRDIGLAKKLASVFDRAERGAASKSGLLPEYDAANKFYSEGIQKFQNTLVKKLADVEPSKLAAEAFKPNSAVYAREIRSALGEKATAKIKRSALENWIDDSIKVESSGGDEYTWGKNLLSKWKDMGKQTRDVWFNPKEQDEIGRLFESFAKFNTRKQNPGLWGMGQLIGTGATLANPAALGGVVLGPYALAKLVASDFGRKWLTEGFKIKPGTKEAINFMGRFSTWLSKENVNK
jgi:hypothetical protein